MIVDFEERVSDSVFMDMVWRGRTVSAGSRLAPAGSCWGMLFEKQGRWARLSIVGPMTKALPMPYAGELEFFVIKFKAGTYMPHLPIKTFLDEVITLPEATDTSFWLNGSVWQIPDYGNVETFVDRLVRKGMLVRDGVVDAVLQSQPLPLSTRSVQRRFLFATGLTHNSIRQISRARQAMMLLQRGASILDTVHEAGYVDQPHMTKSLKHFIGQTPAQIARMSRPK